MYTDIWDQVKYFALLSLIGILSFFAKFQLNRIGDLEKDQKETDRDLAVLKKDIAVLEAEMRNISHDITEIKDGINKLIDKLLNDVE